MLALCGNGPVQLQELHRGRDIRPLLALRRPGVGRHLHAAHPTTATYIQIFVVLFIVTAAEVVAAQILPSIGMTSLVAPSLLIMALVKGALIILYYMHLKSDSGVYAAPMVFGLVLATGMLLTMIGLWIIAPRVPCTPELGKACVVEK
ncbi:MAG: hypothetical protein EBT22_08195 [Chloroflexi bacterium]|nr:hypothetical protein [Chloroflexota bacterium]